MIDKLLKCFSNKFEVGVVPIEEFEDISQMHIDDLIGSMIIHESRMNEYDDTRL